MTKIKYIKQVNKYQELVRKKEVLNRELTKSFRNIYGELKVKDLPLDRTNKTRILRVLKANNINTVNDLLSYGQYKLYKIPNFGLTSLSYLKNTLNKLATYKMFK